MKSLACLIICTSLFLGCATTPPSPPPVTAIVSACPQPPEIARPILALHDLKAEDLQNLNREQLIEKLIKSYTVTITQLMSYINYLEEIIEGYRNNREL